MTTHNPELLARKAEDTIHSISFVKEFSDDHIPCATVNITLVDGSVVENVDICYVGSEGVAALRYASTPEATTYIRDNILQMMFDDALCLIHDGCANEQTEKVLSIIGAKVVDFS